MPQIRRIRITAGSTTVVAELSTSETATLLWDALPFTGSVQTWGDEIYFGTDISVGADKNSSDVVESGELAYWPPGRAFCIFFGATPVSTANESRAASPVNVFGKVDGDEQVFRNVSAGMLVQIEAVT